jgi:hypothetical protein
LSKTESGASRCPNAYTTRELEREGFEVGFAGFEDFVDFEPGRGGGKGKIESRIEVVWKNEFLRRRRGGRRGLWDVVGGGFEAVNEERRLLAELSRGALDAAVVDAEETGFG